ncbi:hypothetical protein BEH_07745 [Priestia filamentosa]|uniref:Uncharacterized protein n=1 Tax=Priestia filamentosa TaxID=1402861 RepID=A0A0H4KD07_9BACI|nr:hypothetical protein [Priestia filamentosa]AKO92002.1 hypothetical protein BEH_07745 [Priestia filamentosa]
MENKLKEVKEFLLQGKGYDVSDVVNDATVETFDELFEDWDFFSEDIDLNWGEDSLTNLDKFSKVFCQKVIKQVCSIIDSFEEKE